MTELLRRVRRTPERLLHPLRRRKVLEAVRARPRPARVLVLCHGNICRSPLAGALLAQALAPLGIAVQSAGFVGFNRPAPSDALAAAERQGVDLAAHRSRLLTADVARAASLIVVMEASQRRLFCERFGRSPRDVLVLGDFDSLPVETRAIRDPLDQGQDVFHAVYSRIARCVRELAQVLAETRN